MSCRTRTRWSTTTSIPRRSSRACASSGLFGATIGEAYGGLGLPCATYAEIVERIARVWMSLTGIFNSHLIMSAIVRAQRHRGAEARIPAALRVRRAARRPGVDRAGLRHRPAGDPRHRAARRRPLRGERHQDLDQQRHLRLVLRAAGEDRSARRAAPSRHEHAAGGERPRLHRQPQAGEAGLQGHRQRGAGVRRLPRAGGPADRRRRRARAATCVVRTGTRPHQRRGARRRDCAGGAGRVAALCAIAQDVRRADRAAPGDPVEAGRHGDAHRRLAPAGETRGGTVRHRRALRHGGRHGETVRHRDRAGERHRGDARAWRLRLFEGVSRWNGCIATRRCW